MHGEGAYVLVAQQHLVGVELVVLALAKHAGQLHNVTKATASCGLFGMLANKGAAMVRATAQTAVNQQRCESDSTDRSKSATM